MKRILFRSAILLVLVAVPLAAAFLFRRPLARTLDDHLNERYYWREIREASARTQIDPLFLMAVIFAESRFDREARSDAGAAGLMQLMPATAREVAAKEGIRLDDTAALLVPATNIRLGAVYLRQLITDFQDTALAIAAYNGGPRAVNDWRAESRPAPLPFVETPLGKTLDVGSFPKEETRRYVDTIGETYARLRRFARVWTRLEQFMGRLAKNEKEQGASNRK